MKNLVFRNKILVFCFCVLATIYYFIARYYTGLFEEF